MLLLVNHGIHLCLGQIVIARKLKNAAGDSGIERTGRESLGQNHSAMGSSIGGKEVDK